MLDEMLKGNRTVEEIVEFFRTYQMEGGLSFEPRVYHRQSRSSSRQSSLEPEEDPGDKLSLKVKTRDNATEIMNKGREKSKENNSNSAVDFNRSSKQKDNTDLHNNVTCKSSQDGHCKDTKEAEESNDGETFDDVKEKGWNNVTEKIEKSLSNLDGLVRNVETENRLVEKLSSMSERQSHESDQEFTNINMNEPSTLKTLSLAAIPSGPVELPELTQMNENKKWIGQIAQENSAARNVFDLVDADFIKRMIPFMHPKSRNHTFKYFLDKVDEVVDTVGEDKLLNSEILDLMQFRYTLRSENV